MKVVYLDHAATTPCHPQVWEAMRRQFVEEFGNANSMHSLGRAARQAVNHARASIAGSLGCRAEEIVFTSGATESNNLAIRGAAYSAADRGRHVVTTVIEHDSVLGPFEQLEREGFEVTYLGVDEEGRIAVDEVLENLRPDTILLSIAHANNEIGTIQPLAEIAAAAKERWPRLLMHSDAVQTVGHLPIRLESLPGDLLTFTAHKCYGPQGIGGLFVRSGVEVSPIVVAAEQHDLRPGTASVALATGMAVALERAAAGAAAEASYWTPIRDQIIAGLLEIEASILNGHPEHRLPTNVNVSFDGVHGEDLVLRLDRLGICASTGSACTTGSVEPSHVITALGRSRAWALGTLRLTLGQACHGLDAPWVVESVRDAVVLLRSTSYRPRALAPRQAVEAFEPAASART